MRHGFLVALGAIFCAMPIASSQAVCLREDATHVVLHRDFASVSDDLFYEVVVTASLKDQTNDVEAAAINFFDENCRLVYKQEFSGADSARVEISKLGETGIFDLIGMSHGTSGDDFRHVLVRPTASGFERLTPFELEHSNMGGFHVGALGKERGDGIAIWDAHGGDGESHYEPHHYEVRFYRWDGTRFSNPEKVVPNGKFESDDPDKVAAKLGWRFRDQTKPDIFPNILDMSH